MSQRRFSPAGKLVRGPGGRWLCRCGCLQECQPPRRTFYSAACVHRYLLRRSGSYLRRCVKARDHGICLHCGVDCLKVRRQLKKALKLGEHPIIAALQTRYPKLQATRSYWEAHHVTPVSKGGGECTDLGQLVTLCRPCHQLQTTQLQKDRKHDHA